MVFNPVVSGGGTGNGLIFQTPLLLSAVYNPNTYSHSIVLFIILCSPAMLGSDNLEITEYKIYQSEVSEGVSSIVDTTVSYVEYVFSSVENFTQIDSETKENLFSQIGILANSIGLTIQRSNESSTINLYEGDQIICSISKI